jgi:putative phage-type endonuclease
MSDPAYEILAAASDEANWLKRRKGGIGASEISVALGVSGWNARLSLYYQKIGAEEPEPRDDEWLHWGKALEGPIMEELARRAGVTIQYPQPLIRSLKHRWAIATPDGLTDEGYPVEAKNISHGYRPEEWEEQIPEVYYLQTHQQMLCADKDRCLFGALLWGSRMIWEWIERDERTIERIIEGGEAFWRCVESETPPMSDGHPAGRKSLARLAVVPQPVEIFVGDETPEGRSVGTVLDAWRAAETDYDAIKKQEKRLKRQRDAAADEVAKLLGEHRAGYTRDGWDVHWQTVERKGYEVKATSYDLLKIKPPKQ